MSSSYPESKAGSAACARVALGLGLALGGACAGESAVAAEVYVQPRADLQAEVDTNRNFLSTGPKTTSEGYAGDVGALWGIATPLSDTTFRAQVGYVDFPKDHQKAAEGSADLASTYDSQRSDFSITGRFDRSDTYSSELASALFNPVVPTSPTTPETGLVTTNTLRTLGYVEPSYAYKLSPRLRVGVSGLYENTDYSGDFASQYVSFDYKVGRVFVAWAATPLTGIGFSPFVSRDAAKSGGAVTTASGVNLDLDHKWSATFSGKLELTGERDDASQPLLTPPKVRSNNFGAVYTSQWTGQTGSVQLSGGRTFTPSGSGGKYRDDQIQLEYDQKLSARTSATYAVRDVNAEPLVAAQGGAYKYLEAVAGLKWLATRTCYLSAGIKYQRLHYGGVPSAAGNGMAYVGIGYQGLGKRP